MVFDSLPKSYLIKQRHDQLSKLCVISQTPGKTDGCQLNFEDNLKENLECFISENSKFDLENNSVRIKLSGDGAQMTRNTNFTIMTFAFLDGNVSAKRNHTIAVIKGSECYQVIKESLRDVFSGINIEDVLEWDKIHDLSKRRCEEKGKHLDNFMNAVRSCEVSFNVWQKAGTTGPSKFETTSVQGDDKKILLRLLPNILELVIRRTPVKFLQKFGKILVNCTK